MTAHPSAPVVVLMGVSGSGKSTVAALLAGRLGWDFVEGDDMHPAANLEKMASGHPLSDEDRLPWLEEIRSWIRRRTASGQPGIVTCSALKRTYRDLLRAPWVVFVYLAGTRGQIAPRLAARHGHFMPVALLDSQFADLEPPGPDENAFTLDIGATPRQLADEIIARLDLPAGGSVHSGAMAAGSSAIEIAQAVRIGKRRAVEVLEQCLATIERIDGRLNAFVHLDPEGALRAAEAVDSKVANGRDPGPLAGVPFGVKDLEHCAGMPTSFGSLLYKGRPPVAADSVPVARMRAAGAIPVGKTAAPEFGAVALTDTKAWGTTRNPWNPTRTPGGSSGGSAAAVASGMVPIATASDGGGSIRIPAAFSGLLGFKPSFGRIPHPDNQPSTTSVFGCLATTVGDAARHLDVVVGPSDLDRFTLPPAQIKYEEAIEKAETSGLRAMWSPDLGFAVVDPEVAAIAEAAAKDLIRAAGLEETTTPLQLSDPVRVWGSSGVLDLFMDLEPGMWPDRADEMMPYVSIPLSRASQATPDRIASIWKRRLRLDTELADLFSRIDVLMTPTTAVPAFGAEWPMPSEIAGTKVHPSMTVPFTMLANLGWHPAVSVPAGLTSSGLPVGLQIQCPRHADALALRLARLFEQARPWPRLAPGYG